MTPALTQPRVVPITTTALARADGKISFWLAAYVALLPFQYAMSEALRLGIADAALIAYVVLRLINLKVVKGAWGIWHWALVCLFSLGMFVKASNAGSLSPYVYLNKESGLLLLFVSYIVMTTEVRSWRQVRTVMRIFVVSVTLQNLVAMAALATSYFAGATFSFINYGNERLSGFLYDPNAYGGILLVALAFNLVGSTGPLPVTSGFFRIFCDVTLAAGILFTFSRSAWIALTAAWLTFLVFRPLRALRMAAVVSATIPVLLLLIGLGLVSPRRMLERPDTIDSRMGLIAESVAQFEKQPLLGMGLGGFREATGVIVHNTFLWFLADFGIVGVVVFAGFIAWFLIAGLRAYALSPPEARSLVLACVVAHIGMLGLSMGIEAFYQRHWWLTFALIGVAAAIVANTRSLEQVERNCKGERANAELAQANY